jgi:hypothetical protein
MAVGAVLRMFLSNRGVHALKRLIRFCNAGFWLYQGTTLVGPQPKLKEIGLYRLRKNAGPGVAPDFSPGKRVFKPA